MDFWVILYSLICVVIGGGAVAFLSKRNQSIGAMIVLVLLLLVFILFGLRWFPGGNLNGSQARTTSWPPIVNMCPDFMASWKDVTTNKIYCYDAANIYGLKSGVTTTGFESKTINNVPTQSALLLQNPSGTTEASKNPLKNIFLTNATTITGNPTTSLIRWEGVWDGRIVNARKIPSI
jgi:hypothetical protein